MNEPKRFKKYDLKNFEFNFPARLVKNYCYVFNFSIAVLTILFFELDQQILFFSLEALGETAFELPKYFGYEFDTFNIQLVPVSMRNVTNCMVLCVT